MSSSTRLRSLFVLVVVASLCLGGGLFATAEAAGADCNGLPSCGQNLCPGNPQPYPIIFISRCDYGPGYYAYQPCADGTVRYCKF